MFANQSDPRIDDLNCTKMYFINSSDVLHPYRYTCFVQDPIFGYVTIGLTHAPGLLLSFFVCYGLRKKVSRMKLEFVHLAQEIPESNWNCKNSRIKLEFESPENYWNSNIQKSPENYWN